MPAQVQIAATLWEFFLGLIGLIATIQGLTLFVMRSIARDECDKHGKGYVPRGECEKAHQSEATIHGDVIRRLERLESSND